MSKTALITGIGGLVGSEATRLLIAEGYDVIGIENNMRKYFFGPEGSTESMLDDLTQQYPYNLFVYEADIRDKDLMDGILLLHSNVDLIIHAAAQPSHDWAAREPHTDFGVNATGMLNLIEAVRKHKPDATFCHISTSKVYGDTPNRLPLIDRINRLDLPENDRYYNGIDTSMSIDNCLHSLFGVSKASGDLIVQEYGRYFQMPTVCFRPGCITGPAHAGVELHGFLAYLTKCAVIGRPYTIFGYEGKQVRCNIYAEDLAKACLAFHENPYPGAIYNIGGGRGSSCSILEAISMCNAITGRTMEVEYDHTARIGDHKWWISNISDFQSDYTWAPSIDVFGLLKEIYEVNYEEWTHEA